MLRSDTLAANWNVSFQPLLCQQYTQCVHLYMLYVRNGIKQKPISRTRPNPDPISCGVYICLWFCLGFVSVPGVHPSWLAALLVWPKWISAKLASTEPNCPKLPQSHCQYSYQGLLHSNGGADNLHYLLCCLLLCAVWNIFSYPPSQRYTSTEWLLIHCTCTYIRVHCTNVLGLYSIKLDRSCICICIDSSATVESGCDKNEMVYCQAAHPVPLNNAWPHSSRKRHLSHPISITVNLPSSYVHNTSD